MRKYLPKDVRDAVRSKFGGRCGYCGEESSRLQIDHIKPVCRAHMDRDFDVNHIDNLMPACGSCNNYKHGFSLESFRANLQDQVRMARAYSSNFRFAERFGLIEAKQQPVLFYFEKVAK